MTRLEMTLAALQEGWQALAWRFAATSLPVVDVARAAGFSAKALAAEQCAAELYRAKLAFGQS